MVEQKERVLVIDDEFGPRESLRFLLKKEYDVQCVDSVDAGIDALRQNTPDMIVLDIKMPGKSGIDGLAEIRELDPHVSVVMLTGFGSLETAQEAMRHGANDYIKKPFDTREMREAVERYVERTKLERMRAATVRELKELNARMQREMAEQENLAVLGEASSEFVHDLRSPLTVICGYVQLLTEQLLGGGGGHHGGQPDTVQYLQQIDKSVRRCREMSETWRELSRFDPTRMRPCSVPELLADVVQECAPLAREAGATLTVLNGPRDCAVRADSLQLFRAVVNLINNAVQAAPAERGEVTLAWGCSGGEVAIEVKDNGPGLPPGAETRLFNSRFTTKGRSGGMGLGLTIVKRVADAHGGSIELDNRQDGSGARAVLRLPRLQDVAAPGTR